MTTAYPAFKKGCLFLTLITLLFLVGIVVLPGLGPTYAEEAPDQTSLADTAPAINHNTWTSGAAMPTARYAVATGVIGTNVYVVGGASNNSVLNVNEIYNTKTNTWTTGASMPTARLIPAAAVVNNILYVIGGCDAGCATGGGAMTVNEAYDPASDTWSTKAPLPTPTDSFYGVAVKGIIYVIGGYVPGSGRVATVFAYDPVADAWSTKAPMKVGKSTPAPGLLGTTVMAAGGLGNGGVVTDNESYNAVANKWKTLAPVPTARDAGCAGGMKGQFYFAGGENPAPLSVLEAYRKKTNSWTTLASMPQAVIGPGSAVVKNLLYCFGGSNNGGVFQGNVYDYVQIYQP